MNMYLSLSLSLICPRTTGARRLRRSWIRTRAPGLALVPARQPETRPDARRLSRAPALLRGAS